MFLMYSLIQHVGGLDASGEHEVAVALGGCVRRDL